MLLVPSIFISKKSESSVLEKFRNMQIHKGRKPIELIAKELQPIIQEVINYYCKLSFGHNWKLVCPQCIYTFVIKQEGPGEGRLSRTVP